MGRREISAGADLWYRGDTAFGLAGSAAELGDVDADGAADLLVGEPGWGGAHGRVLLWTQLTSGVLDADAAHAVVEGAGHSVGTDALLSDLDEDGFGDLLTVQVNDFGTGQFARIFAGPLCGTLGLSDATLILDGGGVWSHPTALSDVDRDGRKELVLQSAEATPTPDPTPAALLFRGTI